MTRLLLASVLSIAAFVSTGGTADAFGGRLMGRTTTCYAPAPCPPVHYHCYPVYCPPYWPQPHPIPVYLGWDCVRNKTNQVLNVTVSSGYGSWSAVLKPGECYSFFFVKDGKPRALTAFTLDNTLVRLRQFAVVDQTGKPKPFCYDILPGPVYSAPTATPEANERSESDSSAPTGGAGV